MPHRVRPATSRSPSHIAIHASSTTSPSTVRLDHHAPLLPPPNSPHRLRESIALTFDARRIDREQPGDAVHRWFLVGQSLTTATDRSPRPKRARPASPTSRVLQSAAPALQPRLPLPDRLRKKLPSRATQLYDQPTRTSLLTVLQTGPIPTSNVRFGDGSKDRAPPGMGRHPPATVEWRGRVESGMAGLGTEAARADDLGAAPSGRIASRAVKRTTRRSRRRCGGCVPPTCPRNAS